MTTPSTAAEIAERTRQSRDDDELRSVFGDFYTAGREQLSSVSRLRFPSPVYQADPVGFFRKVLGVEPWKRQVDMIEAVRDHDRVGIASGHKVSKSHTAAGLALWFYCSYLDARVIMTSTTSRQVDQILWRELRMMRARSGRCVECKRADPEGLLIPRPCDHSALIDGELGDLARTGLKASDFREIVGFTAKESEAVAGISGRNLLYIVDEASGVDDLIFEAIEGNRAGGAKIVMFSNPTRNEGEFFEAFHSKSRFYKTLRVSSEETPNVIAGREVIPGLCLRSYIEEKRDEWGEDSAMYKVRVKGEHATRDDNKAFSIHAIEQAEARWNETAEAGRLFLGVDPAGESGMGDDSAFCARRGRKMLALRTARGLNDDQHLVQILTLLDALKVPRETPVVVIDREGSIGSRLYGKLRAFLEHPDNRNAPPFELVAVRASDRAARQPDIYDRMRDELVANLEAWFADGGAILEDTKLAKELHSFEWKQDMRGRRKITPKDQIKKMIGRSPDRFDALALSVWEPRSLQDGTPAGERTAAPTDTYHVAENTFDPYAGMDAWKDGS